MPRFHRQIFSFLLLHVLRDSIFEGCIYFKMTIFYDGNIVPIYDDIMRINICGMGNNIVTLFPLRLRPLYLNFQVASTFCHTDIQFSNVRASQ